jgi:hydrogenase maturation protein HypF
MRKTNNKVILALGAESAGNFCVFVSNPRETLKDAPRVSLGFDNPYHSPDFGDLLDDNNFEKYKKAVLKSLKQSGNPDIVLTDLHPLYKTTIWGEELAKKFKAEHIKIQHHLAHIFSSVASSDAKALADKEAMEDKSAWGENLRNPRETPARPAGGLKDAPRVSLGFDKSFYGIAMDGTGYGLDGKIWGGEVFAISNMCIERIGRLENQTMISGDLAIREPARLLISILAKIRNPKHDLPDGKAGIRNNIKIQNSKNHHSTSLMVKKGFVYSFVKKYYTKQEFEVLWSQLQQNFNCQETSSTGRILDAVSLLLGFCKNERNYKHEPIDLLEKASVGATPYEDIEPMIEKLGTEYCLLTTPLFEYLIKKIGGKTPAKGEARRLAATAQMYIAQGMYEIVKQYSVASSQSNRDMPIYFAGGIANNKIISEYLESKGAITNKKVPRGDAGLSFGQIMYYLANNST